VFGVNPTLSQERHYEAHDLVVQAWTRPGPFAFEGKHYHSEYVNVWPRPYQQPHPPIWCPSQGSNETIEWAAHPDRKYLYLQNFNPFASAVRYLNYYREFARTRYGYDATSAQLGLGAPCYVADTDEQAMNEAREPLEYLFNRMFKMPQGLFFPPGYTSASSMKTIVSAKSSIMTAHKSLEQLVETGVAIVGSPDTVRRRIADFHRQLGFSNFIALLHFGTLSRELTDRNIRRFARDVLPAIQTLGDDHYQGYEPAKAAAAVH
jgi:alkanesulfonate monooxygenase SsuD/methylene tetrahydromethanopterin reductase-like flavin-dependent oxidoreductase (luciferase family)